MWSKKLKCKMGNNIETFPSTTVPFSLYKIIIKIKFYEFKHEKITFFWIYFYQKPRIGEMRWDVLKKVDKICHNIRIFYATMFFLYFYFIFAVGLFVYDSKATHEYMETSSEKWEEKNSEKSESVSMRKWVFVEHKKKLGHYQKRTRTRNLILITVNFFFLSSILFFGWHWKSL